MDVQIGQRVRISDAAFPGSDYPADIAARGKEATVFAAISDDGCWLVETDKYDLLPVLDTELEPPPCLKCKQIDMGQTGEYPCSVCGLPTLHDRED